MTRALIIDRSDIPEICTSGEDVPIYGGDAELPESAKHAWSHAIR